MNTESIDLFRRRVRENTGCGDLLFGLITDTHFEEKDDPGGYGANALTHLRDFAAAGEACGARFLLHAGDMSNGNRPKEQSRREAFLSAEAMRGSGLPALFVIGNHDDNTYFCRGRAITAFQGRSGRRSCSRRDCPKGRSPLRESATAIIWIFRTGRCGC